MTLCDLTEHACRLVTSVDHNARRRRYCWSFAGDERRWQQWREMYVTLITADHCNGNVLDCCFNMTPILPFSCFVTVDKKVFSLGKTALLIVIKWSWFYCILIIISFVLWTWLSIFVQWAFFCMGCIGLGLVTWHFVTWHWQGPPASNIYFWFCMF